MPAGCTKPGGHSFMPDWTGFARLGAANMHPAFEPKIEMCQSASI